jgi:hypothetical protein
MNQVDAALARRVKEKIDSGVWWLAFGIDDGVEVLEQVVTRFYATAPEAERQSWQGELPGLPDRQTSLYFLHRSRMTTQDWATAIMAGFEEDWREVDPDQDMLKSYETLPLIVVHPMRPDRIRQALFVNVAFMRWLDVEGCLPVSFISPDTIP